MPEDSKEQTPTYCTPTPKRGDEYSTQITSTLYPASNMGPASDSLESPCTGIVRSLPEQSCLSGNGVNESLDLACHTDSVRGSLRSLVPDYCPRPAVQHPTTWNLLTIHALCRTDTSCSINDSRTKSKYVSDLLRSSVRLFRRRIGFSEHVSYPS